MAYGSNKYLKIPDSEYNKRVNTKENGIYAFIYINGRFVGINYYGKTNERNEFTYNYYSKVYGSSGYKDHLYSNYDQIKSSESLVKKILTIANYETLLDKDYFMVFRPELALTTSSEAIKSTSYPNGDVDGNGKVEVKDYVAVRKHILKIDVLNGDSLTRADANKDGNVNVSDYVLIRKIILKI